MQSAFFLNYSTTTALIKVTNDVARGVKDSHIAYLCLFDYWKAFDTINRDLLLAKPTFCGIQGAVGLWFKSYLTNRVQADKIGNITSAQLETVVTLT